MTHAARALQSQDLSGEGVNFGPHTYFFEHTRTWKASPDGEQFNTGTTSEATWTWKTIHTIHTPSHANKVNMKGWLWRPNDIRGPCAPKTSWHLSYGWGKPLKKTYPGNLSRPGIEPGNFCVTGAHATACSTVVDSLVIIHKFKKSRFFLKRVSGTRVGTLLLTQHYKKIHDKFVKSVFHFLTV